jgi:hypothetical protein
VLRIRSYSALASIRPFACRRLGDDIFSAACHLIQWKPGDKWERET